MKRLRYAPTSVLQQKNKKNNEPCVDSQIFYDDEVQIIPSQKTNIQGADQTKLNSGNTLRNQILIDDDLTNQQELAELQKQQWDKMQSSQPDALSYQASESYVQDYQKKYQSEVLHEEPSAPEQFPNQRAEMLIKLAQSIKTKFPQYSITNVLCALQLQAYNLDFSIKMDEPLKNQHNRNNPNNNFQYDQNEPIDLDASITISHASNLQTTRPGRVRERQLIQRQVAHAFITRGYDLTATQEMVTQPLNANKYNSVLTSIIRGSIRKLCDIMNRNLSQNIKEFDIEEERRLRSPLINSKKWLTRSEQNTLFKIISIVYSMNQQPIYQDEVLTLYDKLLKQLHKRNENFRERDLRKQEQQAGPHYPPQNRFDAVLNPAKLQSNNIASHFNRIKDHWHSQRQAPGFLIPLPHLNGSQGQEDIPQQIKYQRDIVELFVRYRNIDSVVALLGRKYNQMRMGRDEVQATLVKLIKVGLKKILKARKEFVSKGMNVPPLNLNEQIVASFIVSPYAQGARTDIIKSLLEPGYTLMRTINLVSLVNTALSKIVNRQ